MDKEREIRLQFLEEAQEYLNTIESGLLGISEKTIGGDKIDEILRAAHSIKGGAAMMGFQTLSHQAHLMEDFFKVLKCKQDLDGDTERLLLSAVDLLRQILRVNSQEVDVEQHWLETQVNPVFDRLQEIIGSPQLEDNVAALTAEVDQDMTSLLFESEVEGCLQRLESVLADPKMPCLREEFTIAAQELAGLGEMLELPAFTSLCRSIVEYLEEDLEEEQIARLAIQELRRSQAMVLVGQLDSLPSQLKLIDNSPAVEPEKEILEQASSMFDLTWPDDDNFLDDNDWSDNAVDTFLDSNNFQEEALDLLTSLESIPVITAAIGSEQVVRNEEQTEKTEAKENNDEVKEIEEIEIEVQEQVVTPSVPFKPIAVKATTTEAAPEVVENTIRVGVRKIEELSELFGELTIERNGLNLHLKSLRNLLALLKTKVQFLEKYNFQLRSAYDKIAIEETPSFSINQLKTVALNILGDHRWSASKQARTLQEHQLLGSQFDLLEMDRYNDLHLLSQEIMETIVQVQEVTSDLEINLNDAEDIAREFERTSKRMQTNITQVRMRPISDLIGRFPRALRDMSLEYNKQVELKVQGSSTLVDRTILEALSDPLLHLLRNAFDHGIEEPATRKALGKPETGTIEIAAAHRGNQTVIVIRDDGGGIDVEKIKARMMQMGLDADDLTKANKSDLLNLIFEPGFSTADRVTDLSGRGVGMDVVRTNLQKVRGKIQVDTEMGVGTTFTITLPFTLSVMRVLLVESGGLMLAFPTTTIEEMIQLKPEMVVLAAGKEVLNWDGYAVQLIRLGQWLKFSRPVQMSKPQATPKIDLPTVLIVVQGEDLVGIEIDRYWEEQEVTVRQVEGKIPMPPGFSGCTILGDGRVVPLIDAIALLRWINNDGETENNSVLNSALLTSDEEQKQKLTAWTSSEKQLVMVVDDSINVRRFLALTLEKAGYGVEQAKDGQDALERVQRGLPIKAVICDIEMPRLDGYGFLAHVKSYPGGKNLPVVMLTSRSGEKHRQLAINLGANAYFSKPFKEKELLETIELLINHR